MINRIIHIILITLVCFSLLNGSIVYAVPSTMTQETDSGSSGTKSKTTTGIKGSSSDDIISGANGFIKNGESQSQGSMNQTELVTTSNNIYNILLAIAMIIAVAVGIVLGIKFMTSSVEEQAKIKEMLVPYVAGCIVVFGAMGIWKLAVNTFSKF